MSRVHVTDQKDMDRFNELSLQKYSDQAVFFMNAFWNECGDDAEKIYGYYQGFLALDTKKEDGCDLDEFYSHKFLENYGETLTALELRDAMRKIDINHDNRVSFLEYLLYRYAQTVEEMLIRPQGTVYSQELIDALRALSQAREEIRKVEAIKAQIEAKRSALEKQSQAGGVKGNKAKQELFALNNEDPTELNAAILTAEAAVRKAEAAVRKAQDTGEKIAPGLTWFMERELEEAKKYKPKGGIQKGDKFKHL